MKDSEAHKGRLMRALEQFKKLEELFLQFAKKASAFSSLIDDAVEDMTDSVRCNSPEEIKVMPRPLPHPVHYVIILHYNRTH